MQYEALHAVSDYYDCVRSGVADLNGAPHYFDSVFDVEADDYDNTFRLYPVSPQFLAQTMKQMAIFRQWEQRFHSGKTGVETHPGRGGIDPDYDALTAWIDDQRTQLTALPVLYTADFRPRPGQVSLTPGVFRELEVAWTRCND